MPPNKTRGDVKSMTQNRHGMRGFENRVALVTGGASGIGRATATRLAAEGAHVIIADNNVALAQQSAEGIIQAGGVATVVETDLGDDSSIEAAGRMIAEQFPALHLLVNNAAILRIGMIEDGGWL